VTWLTPDAPLVEVGGITANLIGSLSDPRAWIDHLEPSQTIYSWAMNNHWHTNYRAEQEGPTVFRFFIWPHGEGASDMIAAQYALELGQPILVLSPRGGAPQDPPRLQQLGSRSVIITAFKPSEDGQACIVRLFNTTDTSQTAQLGWPDLNPKTIWLSDNSERPLTPLTRPIEVPARSLVTIRADLP